MIIYGLRPPYLVVVVYGEGKLRGQREPNKGHFLHTLDYFLPPSRDTSS